MEPSMPGLTTQLECTQQGGPFKQKQVLKPIPASDQVLIRQTVIALNSLDFKQRDHGILISRWPHVLGIEGAGIVEAVGSEVKSFQPGDEVTAWMAGRAHGEDWGGSYQEHVLMPACYVAKKPDIISIEDAASLPICYVTAISAINHGLKIPLPYLPHTPREGHSPSSVLILGASSATGAAAVQLLRLAYPSLPILGTSSPQHHEHLYTLGATKLFDYRAGNVEKNIRKASPDARGIDMIIDCVGAGAIQTDIFETLDPFGSSMYAAIITGADVSAPSGVKKLDINGWSLVGSQGASGIIPTLTKLVEEGKYRVPLPVKVIGHGLEQIPEVLDQVKTVSGQKLVVTL